MKPFLAPACAFLLFALAGSPTLGQAPPANPGRQSVSAAMVRVERHIATLHTRLAITPPQQPQWDAFAAIMRSNARRMEADHNAGATSGVAPNAVADMRVYAASIRLHAEDVERLLPVFEALYNAMSAEQRMKADKIFQQSRRDPRRHGAG